MWAFSVACLQPFSILHSHYQIQKYLQSEFHRCSHHLQQKSCKVDVLCPIINFLPIVKLLLLMLTVVSSWCLRNPVDNGYDDNDLITFHLLSPTTYFSVVHCSFNCPSFHSGLPPATIKTWYYVLVDISLFIIRNMPPLPSSIYISIT